MDFDRLLDRIISAAPLGVAIYLAKNHAAERQKMLELFDRERTAFRDERRELINRVQAPQLIPQGTRPADRPLEPSRAAAATAQARTAFASVGRAAPPMMPSPNHRPPGDGDDL
jgi:hypothetical protein